MATRATLLTMLMLGSAEGLQLSLAPQRRMLTTMSAEGVSRRAILGSASTIALAGAVAVGPALADDEVASAPAAPPAAPPAESSAEGSAEPLAAPAEAPEPPPKVYVKVVGEETAVSRTKVLGTADDIPDASPLPQRALVAAIASAPPPHQPRITALSHSR